MSGQELGSYSEMQARAEALEFKDDMWPMMSHLARGGIQAVHWKPEEQLLSFHVFGGNKAFLRWWLNDEIWDWGWNSHDGTELWKREQV